MQDLQKILLLIFLTCLGQNGHGSEIIHGEKVPENSMQYMVSVQNNRGHVCGGFLVNEEFVVTAAHCDKEKPKLVVFGNHNLNEYKNLEYIEKVYKPRTYVNVGEGDDIMLLKFRKVKLSNRVQTIRLPASDIKINENQQCRVAGWGKTENNRESVNELRMVNVSVINLQECKKNRPHLPANVICAGGYGTNKGFCQGDSGGPLVCNGIAVGVASFNKNFSCNYPDAPNIYTGISKYIQWINQIIKNTRQ